MYQMAKTAIFGTYNKAKHQTARPPFSVYIIKKPLADVCQVCKRSSLFAAVACINSENMIFGIHFKEGHGSLLMHASMARLRF